MYLLEASHFDAGYGRASYAYYLIGYKSDAECRERIEDILSEVGFEREHAQMIIDRVPDVSLVYGGDDDNFEINRLSRIDSPCVFYKTIADSYYRFKSYVDDDTNTEYDEYYFTYYDENYFVSGDSINSNNRHFLYNLELMRGYGICFNPVKNLIK